MGVAGGWGFLRLTAINWCGMGKPKRDGSGFSATKPGVAPKQQVANSSADPAAREQQAVALINQNKLKEAEAIYRALIAAGTTNHITYTNLAAICGMQGRFCEIIELLKKTLQLKPDYPEAHNNLGIALQEQGELAAAIDSYNRALQLKPNYPVAHYNLGNALIEQGDTTAAIDSYNKALSLKPNYPDAHWNLSITMLLGGDYKSGWEKYEWRSKKSKASLPHAIPSCPKWDRTPLTKNNQLLLLALQKLKELG